VEKTGKHIRRDTLKTTTKHNLTGTFEKFNS
jgi:hypothetical protein